MNPPNPNKFIGLRDQQTMGQMMDPLQAEQDFLAKRMSQPVPVPVGQTPMMQQEKGKMQTVQNDPKLQEGSDASYGISGYVNTEKEYKQALQEKNHPNVYNSPVKQANFPHSDQIKMLKNQNYAYKPGDLMDETDFENMNFNSSRTKGSVSFPDISTDDYSDVQENEKGQYMTSISSQDNEFYGDEKRPTSSTHKDFVGKEVLRDTLTPSKGRNFISTWKLPQKK